MDYEKKYKEAQKWIESIYSELSHEQQMEAEAFFPELKESEDEDERMKKSIIQTLKKYSKCVEDGNDSPSAKDFLVKDIENQIAWLEKQGDKDKLIQELGKYKVKYTQEVLEKHINSMSNKDDERLRKTTIAFLKDFAEQGYENAVECIDWLEKQGEPELSEDLGEYIAELSKQFPEVSFAKLSRIAVRVKNWLEKQGKETSWKPSKEEMGVLYGLAYITNQYDEHKEEVITRLYQDLKREFFNGASYENMFPTHSIQDDVRRRSTIQVLEYARSLDAYNQYGKADIDKNIDWLEKQGEQKPAWSEEDKDMLENILGTYKTLEDMLDLSTEQDQDILTSMNFERVWLKSLKQKIGG